VPADRYEVCCLLLSLLDFRKSKMSQRAPEIARNLPFVNLPNQKKLADVQATMNDLVNDWKVTQCFEIRNEKSSAIDMINPMPPMLNNSFHTAEPYGCAGWPFPPYSQ